MKLLCLAWLALCLADDAQNLRGNGKAVTVAPKAAKPEEVGCGWMVESKDGLIMFYQQLWTWCYQQTCCNTHALDHLWVPWYLIWIATSQVGAVAKEPAEKEVPTAKGDNQPIWVLSSEWSCAKEPSSAHEPRVPRMRHPSRRVALLARMLEALWHLPSPTLWRRRTQMKSASLWQSTPPTISIGMGVCKRVGGWTWVLGRSGCPLWSLWRPRPWGGGWGGWGRCARARPWGPPQWWRRLPRAPQLPQPPRQLLLLLLPQPPRPRRLARVPLLR